MKNNKKRIILIITITVLIIAVVGISYAYFTAGLEGAETTTTITAGAGTMNIAFDGGPNILINNIIPGDAPAATKIFTVTGNNTVDLEMPYKINLVIDENNFTTGISYTIESENVSANGTSLPSFTSPMDIPEGSGSYLLGSGFFTKGSGNIHRCILKIYFLDQPDVDQNADQGATFKAHVEVTAAEPDRIFNDYLISLAENSEETGVYHEINGEYYYQGATPNNYLTFNDELWRVIGVFGASTHGIIDYNLVKIIRDSAITGTAFSSSGSLWRHSTLFNYLNDSYYTYNISYEAADMIFPVYWPDTPMDYIDEGLLGIYNKERMEAAVTNADIGLMLLSDYAFSTDSNICSRSIDLSLFGSGDADDCTNSTWLKPLSTEWTISTNYIYDYPWAITYDGQVSEHTPNSLYAYRPAVFLKPSFRILSGDGSQASPYILELAI